MQPPSCPSLARFRYLPIGSPMSSYQAVKKAYFSYLAGGCRQPQNLAASETRQYRGVYPHKPQATESKQMHPRCVHPFSSLSALLLARGFLRSREANRGGHVRMLCRSSGPSGCFILWRWLLRRRSCRELGDRLPACHGLRSGALRS